SVDALTVDSFVIVSHPKSGLAGDHKRRDRLEGHRHSDACKTAKGSDDVDAPRPHRRRFGEPPLDSYKIAIARVQEERPVDQDDVLAAWLHRQPGQPIFLLEAILEHVI